VRIGIDRLLPVEGSGSTLQVCRSRLGGKALPIRPRRVCMRVSIASLVLVAGLAIAALAPAATPKTVSGLVGPAFNISLKQNKKAVKLLAPGTYIFVIDDKSNIHNFHLIGPGVNKKTSVGAVGKTTWRLTLRKGTYRFVCDPHATIMKGKFVVQAP
jgi:plastocyanin